MDRSERPTHSGPSSVTKGRTPGFIPRISCGLPSHRRGRAPRNPAGALAKWGERFRYPALNELVRAVAGAPGLLHPGTHKVQTFPRQKCIPGLGLKPDEIAFCDALADKPEGVADHG
jgi:hypothetical protein